MKNNNQNLIAFLVTLFAVICLAILFSCTTIGGKHETHNTDTTEVCRHRQDTTPLYDSTFVYETKNYRVDVLYSSRKDEIHLVFRNLKEPDMFNVHISPIATDFNLYRVDIFNRFIDIYESNKCRAYEYTKEYRYGQMVDVRRHNPDIPIIRDYYVRLVHKKNASTGNLETFLMRNKKYEGEHWSIETGFKL